jgi:hypothetical protein
MGLKPFHPGAEKLYVGGTTRGDISMLEPWVIDEILRREKDRRRYDRPPLDLPVPDPEWPGNRDPGMDYHERGRSVPERGVVIMGM